MELGSVWSGSRSITRVELAEQPIPGGQSARRGPLYLLCGKDGGLGNRGQEGGRDGRSGGCQGRHGQVKCVAISAQPGRGRMRGVWFAIIGLIFAVSILCSPSVGGGAAEQRRVRVGHRRLAHAEPVGGGDVAGAERGGRRSGQRFTRDAVVISVQPRPVVARAAAVFLEDALSLGVGREV